MIEVVKNVLAADHCPAWQATCKYLSQRRKIWNYSEFTLRATWRYTEA
jgi:hypothetical protein